MASREGGASHKYSASEQNLYFGVAVGYAGKLGSCDGTVCWIMHCCIFALKQVKMLTDTSLFFVLFFFQCLKQYVELLIKEGLETAISCPDAACPKQGHLQEDEA